jgi:uncharacterized protein YndB with AHSA1/START domain
MFKEQRGLRLEPNRSSRHTIGLRAAPADVYRALTDPAELGHWFVAEASVDLRPGGSYRWVFGEATGSPGADAQVAAGEFVTVAENEVLQMRTVIDEVETELECRLNPRPEGTLLTLTHGGFPGEEEWDETFRAIDRSWEVELHVLKIYLERAHGMVRQARFHEASIAASREAVFRSLTTPEGLQSWLAAKASAEAQPGGEIVLEWKDRSISRGHLAVCDPDVFLVMTWEGDRPSLVAIALSIGGEDPSHSADGETTDVRLEHRLFAPDPESFRVFDWDAALGRLVESMQVGSKA